MAGVLTAAVASTFGANADPYFEYTTLLLPGNGTNGAQNNTFLDGSTNNFTITRNGNTTQGTFSPFSQTGWGNYFDGDGDYLTATANAAYTLGTNNHTIECWFYLDGAQQTSSTIWAYASGSTNTSTNSYYLAIGNTSGALLLGNGSGGWGVNISLTTPSKNTWHHLAIVRNGNVFTVYIDGVVTGTPATYSANIASQSTFPFEIGGQVTGTGTLGSTAFKGYISNFRVVNGTAVYTAAFTPPTSELTAITNTILLTCQSNRFKDNSTNNFAITIGGSPSVQAFSPFNPTASWSAATYGGSGYFDGSGDYLSVPGSSAGSSFTVGTGDFTVEAWINTATVSPADNNIFKLYGTSDVINLRLNGNKLETQLRSTSGTVATTTGTIVVVTNSWTHVAWCRSGTTTYSFVNGVLDQTVTSQSQNLTETGSALTITFGANQIATGNFTGYISNLRFLKGQALYTTAFTPSTSPFTTTSQGATASNVAVLLNFTNAGIRDATSKNVLETVGDAKISTAQSKWSGSSMAFDGSGDWLTAPSSPNYFLGTGDFTVECWVYLNAIPASLTYPSILEIGPNFFINFRGSGTLALTDATTLYAQSASALVTGTWYHIAVVRNSGSSRIYINGVGGTAVACTVNFPQAAASVGGGVNSTASGSPFSINGYIQDFRITKGYARYTANFTAPTAAFPAL